MSEFVILSLVYLILFGAVGMAIGQKKGRPLAGLVWSMFFGPIGWMLIYVVPDKSGPKKGKAADCPYCGGVLPLSQAKCNHCGNAVSWANGRAFKPSRAAA